MDKSSSRREFLKTGILSLGSVMVFTYSFTTEGTAAGAFINQHSPGAMEDVMPHISVKIFPGRSEQQKEQLARAIVEDVVDIIQCSKGSVSVAIEDVSSSVWKEEVYDPEIMGKVDKLYKKPGYSM